MSIVFPMRSNENVISNSIPGGNNASWKLYRSNVITRRISWNITMGDSDYSSSVVPGVKRDRPEVVSRPSANVASSAALPLYVDQRTVGFGNYLATHNASSTELHAVDSDVHQISKNDPNSHTLATLSASANTRTCRNQFHTRLESKLKQLELLRALDSDAHASVKAEMGLQISQLKSQVLALTSSLQNHIRSSDTDANSSLGIDTDDSSKFDSQVQELRIKIQRLQSDVSNKDSIIADLQQRHQQLQREHTAYISMHNQTVAKYDDEIQQLQDEKARLLKEASQSRTAALSETPTVSSDATLSSIAVPNEGNLPPENYKVQIERLERQAIEYRERIRLLERNSRSLENTVEILEESRGNVLVEKEKYAMLQKAHQTLVEKAKYLPQLASALDNLLRLQYSWNKFIAVPLIEQDKVADSGHSSESSKDATASMTTLESYLSSLSPSIKTSFVFDLPTDSDSSRVAQSTFELSNLPSEGKLSLLLVACAELDSYQTQEMRIFETVSKIQGLQISILSLGEEIQHSERRLKSLAENRQKEQMEYREKSRKADGILAEKAELETKLTLLERKQRMLEADKQQLAIEVTKYKNLYPHIAALDAAFQVEAAIAIKSEHTGLAAPRMPLSVLSNRIATLEMDYKKFITSTKIQLELLQPAVAESTDDTTTKKSDALEFLTAFVPITALEPFEIRQKQMQSEIAALQAELNALYSASYMYRNRIAAEVQRLLQKYPPIQPAHSGLSSDNTPLVCLCLYPEQSDTLEIDISSPPRPITYSSPIQINPSCPIHASKITVSSVPRTAFAQDAYNLQVQRALQKEEEVADHDMKSKPMDTEEQESGAQEILPPGRWLRFTCSPLQLAIQNADKKRQEAFVTYKASQDEMETVARTLKQQNVQLLRTIHDLQQSLSEAKRQAEAAEKRAEYVLKTQDADLTKRPLDEAVREPPKDSVVAQLKTETTNLAELEKNVLSTVIPKSGKLCWGKGEDARNPDY